MRKGFRQMMREREKKAKTLLCVGLDPLPQKVPKCILRAASSDSDAIANHMVDIVKATAKYALMFKPQRAYYEAVQGGEIALRKIVDFIHDNYPDILVFLDCKRGDISRTQERYRIAHFDVDLVDGMNFSPYMGKECFQFLCDEHALGRAIVSLCYTSNPSAREIQDAKLEDGRYYWEFIADRVLVWAEDLAEEGLVKLEDVGLVMAAAYKPDKKSDEIFSRHLSRGREIVGDKLWFLIPGIGTQGGEVRETAKYAYAGPGSVAISSSSDIIFASSGDDFMDAAALKAKKLRDQMNEALAEIDDAGIATVS